MSISNLLQQNNYSVSVGALGVNGGSAKSSIINMGDSNGNYTIQRTGNNKELSIYQTGDSVNTNLVFTTGTGQIIQYGTGGMQINGDFFSLGDAHISHKLFDGANSSGSAGYLLASTGSAVSWVPSSSAAVNHEIFMNSKGATLINGTFIGIPGYDNNGANVTYSFPRNAVITNIFAQINVAPGNANGWFFWIQKNGVDTALLTTLADNVTQNNQSGSIAYNAGDNFTVRIEKSGSPPNVSHCFVTVTYQ